MSSGITPSGGPPAADRAAVLAEALPYFRMFAGRTVVVKYGGNAMIDEGLKAQVAGDIALLFHVGIRVVVVHGGGPEISTMMERLGQPAEFVNGLRVTDAAAMETVEMVLTGKTGPSIVGSLNRLGARAVGISGKSASTIVVRKHDSGSGDLGFVGDIESVDPSFVRMLVDSDYLPVMSSVATDASGTTYNVNADSVAGHLAAAIGAAKLIVLTDVEGVYRDKDDPTTLVHRMSVADAERMLADGTADRGMIPKLSACTTAVRGGVERAHLLDGRRPHALLMELFTDAGIGTMVERSMPQ